MSESRPNAGRRRPAAAFAELLKLRFSSVALPHASAPESLPHRARRPTSRAGTWHWADASQSKWQRPGRHQSHRLLLLPPHHHHDDLVPSLGRFLPVGALSAVRHQPHHRDARRRRRRQQQRASSLEHRLSRGLGGWGVGGVANKKQSLRSNNTVCVKSTEAVERAASAVRALLPSVPASSCEKKNNNCDWAEERVAEVGRWRLCFQGADARSSASVWRGAPPPKEGHSPMQPVLGRACAREFERERRGGGWWGGDWDGAWADGDGGGLMGLGCWGTALTMFLTDRQTDRRLQCFLFHQTFPLYNGRHPKKELTFSTHNNVPVLICPYCTVNYCATVKKTERTGHINTINFGAYIHFRRCPKSRDSPGVQGDDEDYSCPWWHWR